jgi:hypothetical protein
MPRKRNPLTAIWERCTGCGQEFAFPHLCREHQLCGICHALKDARDVR